MNFERKAIAMQILERIRQGGATQEDLMQITGSPKKIALYGQLSYLNNRALTIAEIDPSKAEFPLRAVDKTYYLGTYDEYVAEKNASTLPKVSVKKYTHEEMLERAQKRVDKASAKLAKATDKAKQHPKEDVYEFKETIAIGEMNLAILLLNLVEEGNYTYERGTVTD